VVLVNVDGKPSGRTEQNRSLAGLPADWTELIAELGKQPSDHLVTSVPPALSPTQIWSSI